VVSRGRYVYSTISGDHSKRPSRSPRHKARQDRSLMAIPRSHYCGTQYGVNDHLEVRRPPLHKEPRTGSLNQSVVAPQVAPAFPGAWLHCYRAREATFDTVDESFEPVLGALYAFSQSDFDIRYGCLHARPHYHVDGKLGGGFLQNLAETCTVDSLPKPVRNRRNIFCSRRLIHSDIESRKSR
jgi:hypothetical protein